MKTTSIRTKMTLLTVCAIVISMVAATVLGVSAIRELGNDSSNEILYLLCETGEKNLDAYFNSIEQSVHIVASYVQDDLQNSADDDFVGHVDRARDIFMKTASQTSGVLTYYYRIDPEYTKADKGFWYINLNGEGFIEHEVTDITLYDTDDTSSLVWFTVPKTTGETIWLSPYFTENLDVLVLSYNVPIYRNSDFVGVVGIEIDYSTMAEQVDNIKLYNNGYAFINDEEGNIIYHPLIDVATLTEENKPKVPAGLLSESTYIRYNYEGTEKQAVWLPLSNGMRLNVTVPMSEINADWHKLIYEIVGISILLLIVFILLTMQFTGHITKPLQELTEVAVQVNHGNYDFEIQYEEEDEVGILAKAFNQLVSYLRVYIRDLNNLAYADALTSCHNKGAFDIRMRELQAKLEKGELEEEFGIAVFDCDNLKAINDRYGHEKGDIYLKNAAALMCKTFSHSPVYRTGGDEFAILLQNDDFRNRNRLIRSFNRRCTESENNKEAWNRIRVAKGLAIYDPDYDQSIDDVNRRADMLMYEDKRIHKETIKKQNRKKK